MRTLNPAASVPRVAYKAVRAPKTKSINSISAGGSRAGQIEAA